MDTMFDFGIFTSFVQGLTNYPLQLAQRQNSSKNWYFSCENKIEKNQTLCMKWAVKPVKKPSGALKELLPCLNKNFSPQTFGPLQTFSTSFILYTTKIVKIWSTYHLLNFMIFKISTCHGYFLERFSNWSKSLSEIWC